MKLATGINVAGLMFQLALNKTLWNRTHIDAAWKEHHPEIEVYEILIRYPEGDESDDIQAVWKPSAALLPAARDIALLAMANVKGEQLGRVVLTRLAPGKVIYPHADTVGAYSAFYRRFHVPIQSGPEVVFACGDERIAMDPGCLYWFDHSEVHTIENRGTEDRINLIVDVRIS